MPLGSHNSLMFLRHHSQPIPTNLRELSHPGYQLFPDRPVKATRIGSERIPGSSWIRFGVTDGCDRSATGGAPMTASVAKALAPPGLTSCTGWGKPRHPPCALPACVLPLHEAVTLLCHGFSDTRPGCGRGRAAGPCERLAPAPLGAVRWDRTRCAIPSAAGQEAQTSACA